MVRAFVELVLLGVVGAALGCWIVLYGLSYSAESLAHGLFPGLALAAVAGFPLLLGATAGIVVAAILIALAARLPAIEGDTAIAVVITTTFGAGALLALSQGSPPNLQRLLFGDVLGIGDGEIALAAALAIATVVGLRILHGRLLVAGFDRPNARMLGADPLVTDVALLVFVAAATVVAVQALGSLLVLAVLVGPAATARLVTRRVAPMMAIGSVVAIAGGASGLYLSYYAGTAAGASVAGCIVALYLAALAAARLIPRTLRAPGISA